MSDYDGIVEDFKLENAIFYQMGGIHGYDAGEIADQIEDVDVERVEEGLEYARENQDEIERILELF